MAFPFDAIASSNTRKTPRDAAHNSPHDMWENLRAFERGPAHT
jgi:hypothetical protein